MLSLSLSTMACAAAYTDDEANKDEADSTAQSLVAPKGYFDGANATHLWGWTCDSDDYSRSLGIHFYVDGPAGGGTGGTFIGSTVANLSRPDVAGVCAGTTMHGFDVPTSPLLCNGRPHTIYAYAIDPGGAGPNPLLTWGPRTLTCPYRPPSTSLKYFGFAGAGEHVAEVAPFSNAVHLGVDYNVNYTNKIQSIKAANARAIVGLHNVLFCKTGRLTPEGRPAWALCSNYGARWWSFTSTNTAVLNSSHVLAFYMADEPTWNGITASDLSIATNLVTSKYPGIPRMVVEAYPAVGRLVVPYNMSWVGFDLYGVKDPATHPQYKSLYATLKSRRTSSLQKMVVIGDAWWSAGLHGSNGIPLVAMDDVATNYFDFARSDPEVVGLFNFLWPSFSEGTGGRDMPLRVKRAYDLIGKSISGK